MYGGIMIRMCIGTPFQLLLLLLNLLSKHTCTFGTPHRDDPGWWIYGGRVSFYLLSLAPVVMSVIIN